MNISQKYVDNLSYRVIGCAIEVYKFMGAGLLESVYEKCMQHELSLNGIHWQAQQYVDINYKGIILDANLRLDILVEDMLIVEIKAMAGILPVHEAQLLTYMRLLEKPKGLILNFNCTNIFKDGQRTLVNKFYGALPKG